MTTTSNAKLTVLIEKIHALLPYVSDTDCGKAFDWIANFIRPAIQEKDRRLARPPFDQIPLESLLTDDSNGGNKKKR
jgi:hypothetical protein